MFGLFKKKKKPADQKPAQEAAESSPSTETDGAAEPATPEPSTPADTEIPQQTAEKATTSAQQTALPADETDETPPTVTTPTEPAPPPAERSKPGLFARLKARLSKTRHGLTDAIASLIAGRKQIDDELLEELEMILLSADVGVEATDRIIANLTEQVSRRELKDPQALMDALRRQLLDMPEPVSQPPEIDPPRKPFVILMVGGNGVGKTTTIGKLARRVKEAGRSVMLAAGDTFRAAAVEQLQTWGERNGVPVVAQKTGADSAAVIYDALQSAQARGVDVLIADTAGRLHTQSNLMEELKKIKRVMARLDETAPHEIMLVVDAATGQNALKQAEIFHEAVGLTGITLTKLDGTAKGGVVVALAERFGVPIRFIGVGESAEDLQPFDAEAFVDALFARDEK